MTCRHKRTRRIEALLLECWHYEGLETWSRGGVHFGQTNKTYLAPDHVEVDGTSLTRLAENIVDLLEEANW